MTTYELNASAKGIVKALGDAVEVAPGIHVPKVALVDYLGALIGTSSNPLSTHVIDSDGNEIDVQHPMPTNGDSVYQKDIKEELTETGTFVGADINSLFNNLDTSVTDSSSENPKWFKVYLERPIRSYEIALVSKVGYFKNVKISLLDRQGTVLETIDDSANSDLQTSKAYKTLAFRNSCCLLFEFHTSDPISLSFIYARKTVTNESLITGMDESTGLPVVAKFDNGEFIVGGQVKIKTSENDVVGDSKPFPVKNYGFTATNTLKQVRLDASTEALMVIDYEHHEIHGGSHFMVCSVVDLAINNVYDLQITTPNTTKWTHLTFKVEPESETILEVYENVTILNAGVAENVRNNDRNSANASALVINGITNTTTANANLDTAIASAILIENSIIGSGRTGGSSERSEEIILKQNTKYTIRFTATTAGYIDYCLGWYEHTSRG